MAASLQDKSMFSLLGHGKMLKVDMKEGNWQNSYANGLSSVTNMQDVSGESYERSCECDKLDGLVNQNCEASAKDDHWIQFVYSCHKKYWLPRLDHLHLKGAVVSRFDVHVCKL